MSGLLLAVLFYRPIYKQMYSLADLSLKTEFVEGKNITRSTSPTSGSPTSVAVHHLFADGTQMTETSSQNPDGTLSPAKRQTKLSQPDFWKMTILIFIQVLFMAMAYGPIAAFLVELFPTRIRYTSMSLPYHIGNGVFGGLTPFIATMMASRSSDPFVGLWYPIIVAAISFVVGMIFLKNKQPIEQVV